MLESRYLSISNDDRSLLDFNGLKFYWSDLLFLILKGKGASLGVGRGRAVAMRAKVSVLVSTKFI